MAGNTTGISRIVQFIQVWRSADHPTINLCMAFFHLYGSLPSGRDQSAVASTCRFILPRLALYISVYGLFIGHPLLAYDSIGQDIHVVVESISAALIALMMCTVFTCLLYRREQLERLFQAFAEMKKCSSNLTEQPAQILARNKLISELPAMFLFVGVGGLPLSLLSIPLLLRKRKFIFDHWYPFDVKVSPIYEVVFCYTTTAHVVAMCTLLSFHTLLLTLLVEASGHFRLLSHNLRRVCVQKQSLSNDVEAVQAHTVDGYGNVDLVDIKTEFETMRRQQHFRGVVLPSILKRRDPSEPMKACVQLHYAILRFVKEVDSTFNQYLFVFIACSLLPAGMCILLMFYADDYGAKTVQYLFLIVGSNVGTAVCFWLGNEITVQNEAVREAVFDCDWFDQSESFKRSMRIIMAHSNQPLVVKVAGFVSLSMETYYAMTKLTYSYIMAIWSYFTESAET